MTANQVGLFWETETKKRMPKPVRMPPERVWDRDDYLPGLDEALAFNVPLMTQQDLIAAAERGETLMFDVESYPNYWCCSFLSFETGKVYVVEAQAGQPIDIAWLGWIVSTFRIVGFFSNNYDIWQIAFALAGYSVEDLKGVTNALIINNERGWQLARRARIPQLKVNHIDLIEVAPLSASLKIYGGRLHAPRMQDLPFDPERWLSPGQMAIVRLYNVNDLVTTAHLYHALAEQISLRERLSQRYGIDLRSKSDAQMAEAVISTQFARLTGARAEKPDVNPGQVFQYNAPDFLRYNSELMQWVFARVLECGFVVDMKGTIDLPPMLKDLRVPIGKSAYRMGVGGLHSTEKCAAHKADKTFKLKDIDVISFYPRIILLTRLFPPQLGELFLQIFAQLVQERVDAKAAGDKIIADCLKILVNGTYGKLAQAYSILYAVQLQMQVCITGQLVLLMLIERLELAGFSVVSANTDGIVVKCPVDREDECNRIVKLWECCTGFETEEAEYTALYSRDVNNYIAFKPDGTVKTKGAFFNPWPDKKLQLFRMHKNPTNQICIEAVIAYLGHGVPLMDTIAACKDVRKFVNVRTVKGGAVKNGEYLGKAIRWYYARGESGEIVYAMSGNKVPRSDGARPLMLLPQSFPADVDLAWYEREAYSMLYDLGAIEYMPAEIDYLDDEVRYEVEEFYEPA